MVAKRGKMEEDMGTGYVKLPFLTDDEVIGLAARKRIAAAHPSASVARETKGNSCAQCVYVHTGLVRLETITFV